MKSIYKKNKNKQNGTQKKKGRKINDKEERKISTEFVRKYMMRYGRPLNAICVSYLKMYQIQKQEFLKYL